VPSLFQSFARAFCRVNPPHTFVLVINGYWDESGQHTDPSTSHVGAGGLSADADAWHEFALNWECILEEYGLSQVGFHASPCYAGSEEYDPLGGERWRPYRRVSLIEELAEVMRWTCPQITAAVISLETWNSLPESFRIAVGGNPYFLWLQDSVQAASLHLEITGDDDPILVLDEQLESKAEALRPWDAMRDVSGWVGAHRLGVDDRPTTWGTDEYRCQPKRLHVVLEDRPLAGNDINRHRRRPRLAAGGA